MEKIIKRNYGIDALRLISMFMVVVLHVLGQGGVLKAAKNGQYIISWLLEIIAYCAVNCYAIISGYVGYSDVASFSRAFRQKYGMPPGRYCKEHGESGCMERDF